ncbi:MAG: VWA domain-containing protein [Desulfobacteraceae bacterium]|nr:VWA domain-containing protein [Desulfobacteraceae bacterium]
MKSILTRWKRRLAVVAASVAALVVVAGSEPVEAAGLLIAEGGFGGVLEIQEHEVDVTINNGVAVTRVTQVFRNTENRQVEALYTFPVPKGASVANFSMWIDGKEMVGEVVEKKRAREIYDSYKRKRRDPGLLEQVDYKRFEMRIFPIAAGAEQKIQIVYYQELAPDHDEAVYVYPLATVTRKGIDARSRTTGKFAMNIEVKSAVPIAAMKSPSHPDAFVVVAHTETYRQASLETTGGSLASDVVLTYRVARPRTGFDLITSRQPGEDGFFMLTLTAGEDLARMDLGMDYVFVLDVSGSMADDGKLLVSKNAIQAFVRELDEKDRFEIMTFSVSARALFGALQPASEDFEAQAETFLGTQQARGGTVLAPAMNAAYRYADPDRPLNVVVLSDGMTEQGERRELMGLIASRPANARVFCIGIGNEVNRPLLEQMADESGGLSAFVSRGDDFQRAAKAFRRKLTRPAAADLVVNIDGVEVFDVEPTRLPNLYHGAPLRIYGRYAGSGDARVALEADVRGQALRRETTLHFPKTDPGNPEIERMWATKRIDGLLKQADRKGTRKPVVDEVIRLAESYSVVTEYTSFLVLENDAEYRRWKIARANRERMARDRKAQAERMEALAEMRRRATVDVGPPAKQVQLAQAPVEPRTPASSGSPQSTANTKPDAVARPQSRDIDFGTGPVGPLFVAAAYWLHRRRRQ